MRLVLDIQSLQSTAHATRGIGRYTADYSAALLAAGAPIDTLACNPELPAPNGNVVPAALAQSGLIAWNTPARIRAAAAAGPLVYHVMSPFEATCRADEVVARHAFAAADCVAVMLYDAIPFRFPERYMPTEQLRRFFSRRAALVRSADAVLAISEHTARDAVDLLGVLPTRVHAVGTGGSEFFTPPSRDDDDAGALAALPDINRRFVLTVTGFEPRKDPETLFRAFAQLAPVLRAEHQLVLACDLPPGAREQWSALAAANGLAPGEVVLTGHVDEELLRALYRRARVFVLTSRAEGFGLPTLEAVRCGCPALTTDALAIPEVLDEPASTFEPGDAGALAGLLGRALADDAFRRALIDAGDQAAQRHTWGHVAERSIEAYEATLRRRIPRASRRPRPRVAFVGPFPPSKSGVAIYTARIAEALAVIADIDCFVEGAVPPTSPEAADSVRRFPISALDRTFSAASYDGVVFTLGNSYFHRETLRLARRLRGIGWIHDASLAGLYLTTFGMFLPDDPPTDLAIARDRMRDAVARCAGPTAPDLGDDWWRTEAYLAAGLSMTEEVTRTARSVIVTTDAAREIIASTSPPDLPITVLPLAVPRLAPVAAAPDDGGAPWIVALGWIDPVKRPDDLVRVVAALRSTTPVRLAFVGEASERQRAALLDLAGELGCADAVTITGFVSDDEYRSWLARASCVVQLRVRTHGEGSAAIVDALGAGRPVVTSISTASELPSGVVVGVASDADVALLAAAVERIITDHAARETLLRAAAAYADSWRTEDVAAALLDAVLSAPQVVYPQPLVASRP